MSRRTSPDSLASQLDSTPDPFPIIQRFHLAEQKKDEFIMRECASQLSMIEYLQWLNTGFDHGSTIPERGGSEKPRALAAAGVSI